MKVAFLTNHISYGGTEVAMYDYAHYNEVLLGNTSIVITRDYRSTHGEIYEKFTKRFPVFYVECQRDIDTIVKREGVDVLYVIKSGELDWFWTTKCKTIVHCVFTTRYPHGDIYCAISESLNRIHGTHVPILPHMISIDSHTDSFRKELGISPEMTVVGRYGSYDTFDLPFVHSVVVEMLSNNPSFVFLAMNTRQFATHPRIIYLPRTTDSYVKRKFINTCDVMLHARARGETFGLACGEFALCQKPIVTYANSPERAHIEILGDKCTLYSNPQELRYIFDKDLWKKDMTNNGYMQFTPSAVMSVFETVFLK